MHALTDIGVNLAHDSFDRDRAEVLASAERAGVTRMIVTGTSVTASARAAELAASDPRLYATAGIHPHHASELDEHSVESLRALLRQPRVVAVGECGLDYFRDFSPRDVQRSAFDAQLALAAESRMPVFLHQRDAHDDFVEHLRHRRDGLTGGVAHCFTAGPEQLSAYLDLGLYIGVTGWVCDERRGAELREALPKLPLDRLLLETDAPYLLPRDLEDKPRNRRNEPRFLPHILERVAAIMKRPADEIAEAAAENTERLFRLTQISAGAC